MDQYTSRMQLIIAATPLFARKGLHGVSVREVARAAGVNGAMISYYFGGKEGLYEAAILEQFAGLGNVAELAAADLAPVEKFRAYIFQCGICFHEGPGEAFTPVTASADPTIPECPRCLNNDGNGFTATMKSADMPADPMACAKRRDPMADNGQ